MRDHLPRLEIKDLTNSLASTKAQLIKLRPLEHISPAGPGFAIRCVILASIVGPLQPKRIFDTCTFRGISAVTMALNARAAEISTLDRPADT